MMKKIGVFAEHILTLNSVLDWSNKCPAKLPNKRPGQYFLYLDKNGNVLENGSDFSEAEKRNTFPVKVYSLINVRMAPEPKLIPLDMTQLQDGDWFEGLDKHYDYVLGSLINPCPVSSEYFRPFGMVYAPNTMGKDTLCGGIRIRIPNNPEYAGTNKLSAEEFLRRADNTYGWADFNHG